MEILHLFLLVNLYINCLEMIKYVNKREWTIEYLFIKTVLTGLSAIYEYSRKEFMENAFHENIPS